MPFSQLIGHDRPKAILKASILHDRVAHAYLFHGEEGIGKKLAAILFAQTVNCDTPYGSQGPDACGTCRACTQIDARTHPDFLVIEPDREMANPQIKIEQVRQLEEQIVYRPLVSPWKIYLLDDADRLTQGAANALLKTLEEPAAHSLFLLVSSRPSALPTTVRSRCQSIRFVPPAKTQVEAALITQRDLPPDDAHFLSMLAQGRIGLALRTDLAEARKQQDEFSSLTNPATLRSISTILTVAESLHKSDRVLEALEWLARWGRDLLLVRMGADPEHLLNRDRLPDLQRAASTVQPQLLVQVLEEIQTVERHAGRNLNLQLALEQILLHLRDAVAPPALAGPAR
ncbi:MAG: DNA polymerase III subunit delta' [Nitrospirota bacterium]|nr:DNA polymerase III subunit delta' [Nitrospirota bacterium]MDE3241509.1 DNA polymerase III subunit delta' [Nitrospirota bacterium]